VIVSCMRKDAAARYASAAAVASFLFGFRRRLSGAVCLHLAALCSGIAARRSREARHAVRVGIVVVVVLATGREGRQVIRRVSSVRRLLGRRGRALDDGPRSADGPATGVVRPCPTRSARERVSTRVIFFGEIKRDGERWFRAGEGP
jgi:hypothetical protein